jgi:hypothetical protein
LPLPGIKPGSILPKADTLPLVHYTIHLFLYSDCFYFVFQASPTETYAMVLSEFERPATLSSAPAAPVEEDKSNSQPCSDNSQEVKGGGGSTLQPEKAADQLHIATKQLLKAAENDSVPIQQPTTSAAPSKETNLNVLDKSQGLSKQQKEKAPEKDTLAAAATLATAAVHADESEEEDLEYVPAGVSSDSDSPATKNRAASGVSPMATATDPKVVSNPGLDQSAKFTPRRVSAEYSSPSPPHTTTSTDDDDDDDDTQEDDVEGNPENEWRTELKTIQQTQVAAVKRREQEKR